jgi:hypothetical protein
MVVGKFPSLFVVAAGKKPITFTVESDMPHISGDPSIEVTGAPDEPEREYELTFHPQLGGTYSGTIHFIDPATGRYQWYTIEMTVEPPPPEDRLVVEAIVRQAVSLEISLTNPLQQVIVSAVVTVAVRSKQWKLMCCAAGHV